MTQTLAAPAPATRQPSRLVWLLAGVLGTASLAAGAHLFSGSREPAVATVPAPAAPAALADKATTNPLPAATPAAAAMQPSQAKLAKTASPPPAQTTAAAPATSASPAPAPVCKSCGVVESVRTVTHKGEGSGVGAVAGGVLGAAVGNQMGKGDGRKAMTVLGALGGGLAGHEVEKRSKSATVHEVQVRMDDGTLRTVQQAQAPRTGARVRMEGQTLKVLASGAAGQG